MTSPAAPSLMSRIRPCALAEIRAAVAVDAPFLVGRAGHMAAEMQAVGAEDQWVAIL